MKRTMSLALCAAMLMLSTVGCKKRKSDTTAPKPANQITDTRDSKVYPTVTIGTQTWMASNLKYKTANSICPNNDCDKYGVYYTATDAKTACPSGFHLPTDSEWKKLEFNVGMLASDTNSSGDRGAAQSIGTKLYIGGSSGLNLPYSGSYDPTYLLYGATNQGYYWTATLGSNTSHTMRRIISTYSNGITRDDNLNTGPNYYYYCIRCLKN